MGERTVYWKWREKTPVLTCYSLKNAFGRQPGELLIGGETAALKAEESIGGPLPQPTGIHQCHAPEPGQSLTTQPRAPT